MQLTLDDLDASLLVAAGTADGKMPEDTQQTERFECFEQLGFVVQLDASYKLTPSGLQALLLTQHLLPMEADDSLQGGKT